VKAHAEAGADYIGCGPFRFTTTKERLSPVLGLEGYRQITERMRNEHIDLPIVAIGGITAADVPSIMKTGVTGIAISGAVINAVDPVDEMKRLIKIVDNE
jgi:thiamine-phosphate pyrophosphorylase